MAVGMKRTIEGELRLANYPDFSDLILGDKSIYDILRPFFGKKVRIVIKKAS